jgi:predicted transcriptional regulator
MEKILNIISTLIRSNKHIINTYKMFWKRIHIGKLIKEKVEASNLSIAEFATMINRTRPTVYDIFERDSIDIDLLLRISDALHYNFLKEVYLNEINNVECISKEMNQNVKKFHYIIGVEVDEEELVKFINNHDPSSVAKVISINKN